MNADVTRSNSTHPWQLVFLAILPTIRHHVCEAFRHVRGEERAEATQEAIANACVAFARLAQRGRAHYGFAVPLARYAVAQVSAGRRIGGTQGVRDVLSWRAQQLRQFRVEQLEPFQDRTGDWMEAVVADRRAPIPEQVCFRIDFPVWLGRLTARQRKIVRALAIGHRPGEVARRFRISPARISQLRQEFFDSWQAFHGDAELSSTELAKRPRMAA